jgi:Pyruvate/2-oxoacid:ferredoxin oxidoreductase delta subunit
MKNINSERIIKNINFPSCKNCRFFKPYTSIGSDFASSLAKCEKFGEKNILTDVITYDYASSCRISENMCGESGTYFEPEPNINLKIVKHRVTSSLPNTFTLFLLAFALFFGTIKPR